MDIPPYLHNFGAHLAKHGFTNEDQNGKKTNSPENTNPLWIRY